MKGKTWGIFFILLGAASYGMLSPFIKTAYEQGYNEAQITWSQITMGACLMLLLVAITPKSWSNPFRGPWIRLSVIGIFGLACTTLFYNTALSELDASLAIVLLFQFTWMAILWDCLASRKWPTAYQWLAVGMVLIGTLFAVNVFAADLSRFSLKGLLYGLGSGLTYSLFIFGAGRVRTTMHTLMKSAVMLVAAVPVIYVLYPPTFLFEGGSSLPLVYWGLLLCMLGQVIPTISFNVGIPRIGSSLAAMLASVELPVAVVAALLILGETVVWVQWIGMLFILGGIIVSEKGAGGQPHGLKEVR